MKISKKILALLVILLLVLLGWFAVVKLKPNNPDNQIRVVAAENFWGSLINQIGGNRVNVTSVISNPNIDPHEYESNSADAIAISKAQLVVVNGEGYDSWASQLVSASPSSDRQVLNIAHFLNQPTGANPHFWYNPSYVNRVDLKVTSLLIKIDPSSKSYFEHNLNQLNSKMQSYLNIIKFIKSHYPNEKVAATESIFVYMAHAMGLDLISPPAFITAVAEGNDPPAPSVVEFENQLNQHQVKLLVYNVQTVTPLTSMIRSIALKDKIPVVGISETIQPPNLSFENWMKIEVTNIEQGLSLKK